MHFVRRRFIILIARLPRAKDKTLRSHIPMQANYRLALNVRAHNCVYCQAHAIYNIAACANIYLRIYQVYPFARSDSKGHIKSRAAAADSGAYAHINFCKCTRGRDALCAIKIFACGLQLIIQDIGIFACGFRPKHSRVIENDEHAGNTIQTTPAPLLKSAFR